MRGVAVAVALAIGLAASPARADDDKQRCLASYEAAQTARDEARLLDEHAFLETCGRDVCPARIRKDCVDWLALVEESTPTLVFAATDEAGGDLHDVTLSLDNVSRVLDGRAVAVDPGPHVARFEAKGRMTQRVDVVVRQGEKNRLVSARLASVSGPKRPEPAPRGSIAPYAFGGVTAVALGVFGFFAIRGATEMWSLQDGCGKTTSCRQEDVDSAHAKLVVGDLALGVALIAGGLTLYTLLAR